MSSSFTQFWYDALHATIGVIVTTNDRHTLRQRLYAARRQAMDVDLEGISIVFDPVQADRLWLVKRKIEDAPS